MRQPLRLVATVAAFGFLAAACGDSGPSEYSAEVEANFVDACLEKGGAEFETVCGCTYGKITEEIAFDRFEEIDKEVREDPESLPQEVVDLLLVCVEDHFTAES